MNTKKITPRHISQTAENQRWIENPDSIQRISKYYTHRNDDTTDT